MGLRLRGRPSNTFPQAVILCNDRSPKVQAQALMEMPTEDGITTAGPTFEYVPPSGHPLQRSQPEGAGPGADGDADRGWDYDCGADLRIRSPKRSSSATIAARRCRPRR